MSIYYGATINFHSEDLALSETDGKNNRAVQDLAIRSCYLGKLAWTGSAGFLPWVLGKIWYLVMEKMLISCADFQCDTVEYRGD